MVHDGNPNERSKPNAAMYQGIVARTDLNKGYLAKGTNEWKIRTLNRSHLETRVEGVLLRQNQRKIRTVCHEEGKQQIQ